MGLQTGVVMSWSRTNGWAGPGLWGDDSTGLGPKPEAQSAPHMSLRWAPVLWVGTDELGYPDSGAGSNSRDTGSWEE